MMTSTVAILAVTFTVTLFVTSLSGGNQVSLTSTVRDYMLPDDWVSYGGKQYLFVMDAARGRDLSRDEAMQACQSIGAELVSIDAEDEFEMLKREIRQRVIGAGQEFAHERWWTAGSFLDNHWVWDHPSKTTVTVSALKRKNVPQDGLDYFLALSHGYDQQGWRLRPVPGNYELRYICQKGTGTKLELKSNEGNFESDGNSLHVLNGYLSRTKDVSPHDNEQVHVSLRVSSLKLSTLEWKDRRLQWNSTRYSNTAVVTIATDRIWNPTISLPNGFNKRHLIELVKSHSLIQSNGVVQTTFVEELCTVCESRPSMFPFDRMHCSLQLTLNSPGSVLRPLSTSGGTSITSPFVQTQDSFAWTFCSDQQLAVKRLCTILHSTDDVSRTPSRQLAEETNNNSSSTMPRGSAAVTDVSECLRYDLCFQRMLLFYAVVLLSPTGVVTVLVLVVFATTPPANVKLPALLASITICCMTTQFCCSLVPTRTLPVVVIYPVGLVALSLISTCVTLVINRRQASNRSSPDADDLDEDVDHTVEHPEVVIDRYAFSRNDNGNHRSRCWQSPINHTTSHTSASGMTSHADLCQQEKRLQELTSSTNTTSSCVGPGGCQSTGFSLPSANCVIPDANDKLVSIPVIVLSESEQSSNDSRLSRLQSRLSSQIGADRQLTGTGSYRDMHHLFEHNEDSIIADKLSEDDVNALYVKKSGNRHMYGQFSLRSAETGCAKQRQHGSSSVTVRNDEKEMNTHLLLNCTGFSDKPIDATIPSSLHHVTRSNQERDLVRRARIERVVDITLFIATIILCVGFVAATTMFAL